LISWERWSAVVLGVCAAVALLHTRCIKDPSLSGKTLRGDRPRILGHGGMGIAGKYPMDSFESLSACLNTGADGTEMDVQITADSVLVLYHSRKLDDMTYCEGAVIDRPVAQLAGCKYTHPVFGEKPFLCEARPFFAVAPKDRLYVLECKIEGLDSSENVGRFARAIVSLINKYELRDRCYVESYNVEFLDRVAKSLPGVRLFIYSEGSNDSRQVMKKVPIRGLTIDISKADEALVREAHERNLEVSVFNVRSEADNKRAVQIGADNIQTDRVNYLVDLLN
jgi:glycerophosphoryl diester phosphodiesterase